MWDGGDADIQSCETSLRSFSAHPSLLNWKIKGLLIPLIF
jgi:hypothetical protein